MCLFITFTLDINQICIRTARSMRQLDEEIFNLSQEQSSFIYMTYTA